MRLAIWRREIVCRQAVTLVTKYLEGAMPARERARFERHLALCDGCDEYLAEMRATIRMTGRLEPEDVSPEAMDEIVEVVLRFKDENESEPGSG